MPGVFRSGRVGSLELPNRIVMGAMHLNLEGRADDGAVMSAFYAERARGGVGLIITGGCAVDRAGSAGRSTYPLITSAKHQRAMARWVRAVHEEEGRIALQLFHAGRYTSRGATGESPVAPSAVPSRMSPDTPLAMTEEMIERTIDRFALGALTARELGFDAIEIMGSEGYLINQFTSPLTNRRDDSWGGDAERRMRFPLELLKRLRCAVGNDYPVIFRMSGDDLMPGAPNPYEVLTFAERLACAGADAINVGVGWHESRVPTVQTVVPPGSWTGLAEEVKRALAEAGLDTPVIASNRINRMELAEEILASGSADFVSMARPLLADPQIVRKHADPRRPPVNRCIACNEACIDRSLGHDPVSCLVNPRAGREAEFPGNPAPTAGRGKRFAVVGGGPAGLSAARTLAELGADVELFEAEDELGGQFTLARLVPGKADFGDTVHYYGEELARLGVRVRLGRQVGPGDVRALAEFAGVVLAAGAAPRALDLPGMDLPNVCTYPQAFRYPQRLGVDVAVVGGGGIAVDLAHLLSEPSAGARSPRHITLMRRRGRIGEGMGRSTRWALVDILRDRGVELLTGVTYEAVVPDGVRITDADGRARLIPADSVVAAVGHRPDSPLAHAFDAAGLTYRAIGAAGRAAGVNAVRAMEEGFLTAYELIDAVDAAATPELSSHGQGIA